jgi:hypothetical protein
MAHGFAVAARELQLCTTVAGYNGGTQAIEEGRWERGDGERTYVWSGDNNVDGGGGRRRTVEKTKR